MNTEKESNMNTEKEFDRLFLMGLIFHGGLIAAEINIGNQKICLAKNFDKYAHSAFLAHIENEDFVGMIYFNNAWMKRVKLSDKWEFFSYPDIPDYLNENAPKLKIFGVR